MRPAPRISHTSTRFRTPLLGLSTLCLCLLLTACQNSEPEQARSEPETIELIQDDVVAVQTGDSVSKSAFTGTIRAVQHSSIQAQVTATASAVNAQVGQRVSKGQVLVRLNNQDNAARLAQARANLASTQAQANQARVMMERKRRLLNQGFISKVEYEQSQVDYRAQLENVRAQQANVDIAEKADRDGTILSPINGVITQRQVEPGQTLFEIVNPDRLEIQAKLPSDQQSALKVGQKIEYKIQGNPAQLTATLSRVSPIADLASRQIEFFATPNESINSLSIGAFVEGNIISSNSISGQLIPLDTIQDIQNKPYVWAIRQNKIVRIDIHVLEQRYSDNTAIVSGLQAGDLVSRVKFSPQNEQQPVSISQTAENASG